MTELYFMVAGVPRPQGSAKAFVIPAKGDQKPRAVVTSDTKDLKPWRNAIAEEARKHCDRLFEGAAMIEVLFIMPRPKTHWSARGGLKPSAPIWPTTRPDVDKLARAVLDALTGIVVGDDAQVVTLVGRKEYQVLPTSQTGVQVWVKEAR